MAVFAGSWGSSFSLSSSVFICVNLWLSLKNYITVFPMRRCAFLTMENPEGFVIDDELAHGPLRALGWGVEAVPWRRAGVDWNEFEAVVIRSTWDYQNAPDEFFSVLERVEASRAHLENRLDLVRWNLSKTYLRDLERRGVGIVPTVWGAELGPVDERAILDKLDAEEVVLKPVVGANADHTFRLRAGDTRWYEVAANFARRPYLAQPFIRRVVEEGEYSLIFFNGELSHTILKTPKMGDFRVQEEHGGIIQAVKASQELRLAGERVMTALVHTPLYARADFVELNHGGYGLMELEIIEPALYLRMDAAAPERFARAIHERVLSGCR
jgi:glutathione synthase/RimK-type ligase-like ATP-grasp enzyme